MNRPGPGNTWVLDEHGRLSVTPAGAADAVGVVANWAAQIGSIAADDNGAPRSPPPAYVPHATSSPWAGYLWAVDAATAQNVQRLDPRSTGSASPPRGTRSPRRVSVPPLPVRADSRLRGQLVQLRPGGQGRRDRAWPARRRFRAHHLAGEPIVSPCTKYRL